MSTTSGRLQASVRKVNALIKKAGIGGQLMLIVFLVLLLVGEGAGVMMAPFLTTQITTGEAIRGAGARVCGE